MNPQNADHPAVILGSWVKSKRQEIKVVASRMASEIRMDIAKYAEFECGIGAWLSPAFRSRLRFALMLPSEDVEKFNQLCQAAEKSRPLAFGDQFTREQLHPVRLRLTNEDEQLTTEDAAAILDQVFAPLS